MLLLYVKRLCDIVSERSQCQTGQLEMLQTEWYSDNSDTQDNAPDDV